MADALVTGAGGFIGHHVVSYLKDQGYTVRGADLKEPEFEPTTADEFLTVDLRDRAACDEAVDGVEEVYHLAADMGGIGYMFYQVACRPMRPSCTSFGRPGTSSRSLMSGFSSSGRPIS